MPPVKRSFVIASLLAAVVAAPASGQPTRVLMPGVTYDRHVEFTLHGPVAMNVIQAPRPTGLYSLEPVLANSTVQGKARLTTIERRLAPQATVAAVNGDLFGSSGRPQGLFLQDGVMQTEPLGSRSSLAVDPRGTLAVDRIPFIGDWRGLGPRRTLSGLNDQAGPNGTVLYTPAWGALTPANPDAIEAVLSPFPATAPNTDLTANVTQVLQGGNHPPAAGTAILYARGNAATRLAAEAAVGTALTVRLILPSPFSTASAGIGGGPLLVRNGKPVFRSNESFPSSWLIPRTARTAVGQRADGSVLLVTVDGGRPGSSVGMTNFELAQELAGLGAVTAMGLDGGPSSTMAFDGELLNKPPNGEKPIADALALLYSGVQAGPVAPEVLAPGTQDGAALTYKLVRPATVTARLVGPGGAQVELDKGQRSPGTYRFTWRGLDTHGAALPEGRWTWKVTAVDDLGRASEAERPFSLNGTLQRLAVSGSRVILELARPATLTVRIERSGAVLRTLLLKRQVSAGTTSVTWDGRLDGGLVAPRGTYVVRATVTNQIGSAELTATIRRR
jgi:exopolysaccharide biosynthesis protein/flagellar hook assembly protein FlgD